MEQSTGKDELDEEDAEYMPSEVGVELTVPLVIQDRPWIHQMVPHWILARHLIEWIDYLWTRDAFPGLYGVGIGYTNETETFGQIFELLHYCRPIEAEWIIKGRDFLALHWCTQKGRHVLRY